jgi:catechol 2,3-dioxygenase-like lactoylglutathione lyase family enzyme
VPSAVTAIDHLAVACGDLAAASEPWRRLGFLPVAGGRHPGLGTENAVVFVGSDPETMFYIEFITIHDSAEAAVSVRGRLLAEAIDAGGGGFRLVLEAGDPQALEASLTSASIEWDRVEVRRADGSSIGHAYTVNGERETSLDPRVLAYGLDRAARFEGRSARGLFGGTFAVSRLDHVALLAGDLEAETAKWRDAFGIPPTGEVRGPGIIVRQFQVGDGVVELLAASDPSSRLAAAPPGLRSMVAFEVDDLDVAVATARERGFELPDGATGILPGTRTATISPDQLSGVALQLLEYA